MNKLSDWDFEIDWDKLYDEKELEIETNKGCLHEWKGTALFFTIVYDCKLCGKKKEEC